MILTSACLKKAGLGIDSTSGTAKEITRLPIKHKGLGTYSVEDRRHVDSVRGLTRSNCLLLNFVAKGGLKSPSRMRTTSMEDWAGENSLQGEEGESTWGALQ